MLLNPVLKSYFGLNKVKFVFIPSAFAMYFRKFYLETQNKFVSFLEGMYSFSGCPVVSIQSVFDTS